MSWDKAVALSAMKSCCEEIVKEHTKMKPPARLWHYTNTGGFKGIVESNLLHFTNLRFLNDSREFLQTIELMKGAINDHRLRSIPPEGHWVLDRLKMELDIADEHYVPWTFVCCFSGAENDLSQWRGYGGTLGLSVGFDSNDLAGYSEHSVLLPCLYDHDVQMTWLVKAVGELIKVYVEHGPKVHEASQAIQRTAANAVIATFLSETGPLTAMFKQSGFHAEDEWRLVVFNPPDSLVAYHAKKESITPYLPVKPAVPRLPIKDIFVGPGRHNWATALSAMQLMQKEGFNAILPKVSDISYRPMV